MSEYSIRDLEKISGIKAHTIRIWEKRYNLVCPKRTNTNIRYYSDEDLKKILNISILNRHGVKISKIANLEYKELTSQVIYITNESWSHESQIENLVISMVEFDEMKFEKILSKSIIQTGFEETIIKIIYPFLNRIGVMWQTNNINPAQEHFISNLIRQKIISAIDNLITLQNENSNKFILYLPDGELHELALLFMYYIIKKRGHRVIYLGQSVSLNNVVETHNKFKADYLITYLTSSVSHFELQQYIETTSKSFNNSKIIIAGNHSQTIEENAFSNVIIMDTIRQFIEYISE